MRILASNPDTIGDVILRQPLYAALQDAGHELLLIVRPQVKAIAHLIAPYARLLELPLNPYGQVRPEWGEVLQPLFAQARSFNPDLLLIAPCQWTLFEEQLAHALDKVPVIGMSGWLYPGSAYDGEQFESTLRFTVQAQVERTQHELVKNERLCEAVLGKPVQLNRPQLAATAAQRYLARLVLEKYGWSTESWWLGCVGTNASCRYSQLRNWTEEKWTATIRHAIQAHGRRFVLVGLPEEQDMSRRIQQALGAQSNHVLVIDEPEAGQDLLIGLAALAEGYLGRDTGPMHLAAALGKPVVAVFGGGHWPQFTPVAETARVFTMEVPCIQCEWLCHRSESHCVKAVPVEAVTQALDELQAGQRGECRVTVLPVGPDLVQQMDRETMNHARQQLLQIGRQRRELSQAQQSLADADQRARQQDEEHQAAQVRLQGDLDTVKQARDVAQTECTQLRARTADLAEANARLVANLEQANRLLEKQREKTAHIQKDLASDRSRRQQLTAALTAAHAEATRAREALTELELVRSSLAQQLQEAREAVGRESNRTRQLRKQLDATRSELNSLLDARQRVQAELQQTAAHRDNLQGELRQNQAVRSSLQAELQQSQAVQSSLQAELQQVRDQQLSLQWELQRAREYQSTLLARIDELLTSRWRRLGRSLGVSKPASFERRAS